MKQNSFFNKEGRTLNKHKLHMKYGISKFIYQLVAVVFLLVFVFLTNPSLTAQKAYTISSGNNYLAHRLNTTTNGYELYTTRVFSDSCVWYSPNTNNYYFMSIDGSTRYYLSAAFATTTSPNASDATNPAYGAGAPLTIVAEDAAVTGSLGSNTSNYYFYNWDWGLAHGEQYATGPCPPEFNSEGDECWRAYWLVYDGSEPQWHMSTTSSYEPLEHIATFEPVRIIHHDVDISTQTGGLSAISGGAITYGSSINPEATIGTYSDQITPEYTSLATGALDNCRGDWTVRVCDTIWTTHNFYPSMSYTNDHGTAVPPSSEHNYTAGEVTSYSWTLSGAGTAYLTLSGETTATPTVTYSTPCHAAGGSMATLTLTVTWPDGSMQTQTVEIMVNQYLAPPTSITIAPITMTEGETTTLSPTFANPEYSQLDERYEIISSDASFVVNNTEHSIVANQPGTYSIELRTVAEPTVSVNVLVTVLPTAPMVTFVHTLDGFTPNTTIDATTSAASAVTYYTLDGDTPMTTDLTATPIYTAYGTEVRAVTYVDGLASAVTVVRNPYNNNTGATVDEPYMVTDVSDLAYIASNPTYSYILAADIDATSLASSIALFTGTLDGNYHTISGLGVPLFGIMRDATVKNLRIDNVHIASGNNVGAVCGEAHGNSKIYNTGVLSSDGSSSIAGTDNVGGLAGLIDCNTRVVNCYNYATIEGGNFAAGIVGKVETNTYHLDGSDLTGWTYTGTYQIKKKTGDVQNGFFVEPDYEVWGNGNNIRNQTFRYTFHNVPAGTYDVIYKVWTNNSTNPTGLSFYINGNTTSITTSMLDQTTSSGRGGRIVQSFTLAADGDVTLGFNVSNAGNFTWLRWDDVRLYCGSPRVSNCMMYGDITGGTNISPVYGGSHVSNDKNYTEYNFWRSRANLDYTVYNDQLAIDKDDFLTRFPFYRHILNTHREMAALFLYGNTTTSLTTSAPSSQQIDEIGHWVLRPDVAPYPIVEPWETNTHRVTQDIVDNLPSTEEDYAGRLLTEMGDNGYLHVTVKIGTGAPYDTYNVDLPITDMDTLRHDFTWGKVVLPFANEFSGWTRDYSKVCTGWKVTSVTKEAVELTEFSLPAAEPYNFTDRSNAQKDIYHATNNPYVFAQGGNFIVPYDVTAITIESNFANAFYLSDAFGDFGYSDTYQAQTDLGWAVPTTYHGRTVYTNLQTLVEALETSTNPHTQAIVLVGNFHYNQKVINNCFNTGKAVTIMSADDDNNQEPDYGWYSYHSTDRTNVPPMRFDFVPNIGMGMAARVTGSTPNPTIGIWHAKGWFELTETCVSFMSECEINSGNFASADNGHGNNRWIANSGYFIQIVRCRKANCSKLSYAQIGGNAYVKEFYPGSHTDDANTTTLRPILVTGGEIEECYMTGYRAGASATGSDIRFWGGGGKIHKWLGAYMENPSTAGVNVTAKIDHAVIGRFFGGGTSAAARITGNINITMNNSLVDFYCGGPEFGNMSDGKSVTTHAKGSVFGEYYGAGFGGTSVTYNREGNQSGVGFGSDLEFPIEFTDTYKRLTNNATYGIGSCYKFEFILYSGGNGTGVARSYTGYAQFSLAQTGNVTNLLEDCVVKGDFYGGGCQGKVAGTVTSTLTNCTLMQSAYGGGYKASANTLSVYPATEPTKSVYSKETGLFSDFGTVEPETFTWQYRTTTGSNDAANILYTNTDMSTLGNVTGAISITIDGGTVAESVFGGGNESPSQNTTEVRIKGDCNVSDYVFGGGNNATVNGNTTVHIQGHARIGKNVYGGGNIGPVGGDTHVLVGDIEY